MVKLFQNHQQDYGLFYFKLGILLFWGIWFFIAFLTNIADFHYSTNTDILFSFRSGNYSALAKVIMKHQTSYSFLNILFSLDIIAEALSAILFFRATFCFLKSIYIWKTINLAFSLSISLWGIFIILEEIFIAYSYEATHIRLCIFEILSLLTVHFLPHRHTKCNLE